MPACKPQPPDERPQSERFIETAREIGASEDPKEFEVSKENITVNRVHRTLLQKIFLVL
jgi:hypothetical protein